MFPLTLAQAATDLGAQLFQQILAAFNQKNWYLLVVLLVIALVAAVRKFADALSSKLSFMKFFTTDRGGAVLALVFGFAGAFAADAASGAFHLRAVLDGLVLAFTSAGGYVTVKKIIWPSDPTAIPAPVPTPDPVPAPTPPAPPVQQ